MYKRLKKKEVKDEIYELIRNNIIQDRKFISAIKNMILNRNRKYEFKNNIMNSIVSEIESSFISQNRVNYLNELKENYKINIMEINRVKSEYKIKSKTVLNLLERIEKFEYNNLEAVANMLNEN